MPKGVKLAYHKCERCRKDRQKCIPVDRTWPGRRCDRCLKYGYACSANRSKDQELNGTHQKTADRVPAFRSSTSGDLRQMTDMQCVQEFDDLRDVEEFHSHMFTHGHLWRFCLRDVQGREADDEVQRWVYPRKYDVVAEIRRRASQHEASGLCKDAEFLYRRISATVRLPIEAMHTSSWREDWYKLVQIEEHLGDFSTAECIQEYLLINSKIREEPGDLEELANGLVGLYTKFSERMKGRGKFITVFANLSKFMRAVAFDHDALNRLFLQPPISDGMFLEAGALLKIAAHEGAVNLGRSLINGGADVDHQDGFGMTALSIAASQSNPDMVRLLLENKAKVDLCDECGDTALHSACDIYTEDNYSEDIQLQTVRALVRGGVNINAENTIAETALYKAIQNSCDRSVSYLLHEGACTEASSDHPTKKSQIVRFRLNREPRYFFPLIPKADLFKQVQVSPVLHLAVRQGKHNIVRELIDHGADVNAIDKSHRTALTCVREDDDREDDETEMETILLKAGAIDMTAYDEVASHP